MTYKETLVCICEEACLFTFPLNQTNEAFDHLQKPFSLKMPQVVDVYWPPQHLFCLKTFNLAMLVARELAEKRNETTMHG